MRHRVVRLSVHQTSKMMAALYGLTGLVFFPFFLLVALAGSERDGPGWWFWVLLPALYALFGYVFVAVGCALYNLCARWTGGVEVQLVNVGGPPV